MPYVRNKKTGETRWIPDQGPPADPTFPYKGEAAALDNQSKRADIQNDAQRLAMDKARLDLARQQATVQQQQEALKLEAARKDEEAKSAYNPQQIESVRNDAMNKLQTLDRIGKNYADASLPAIGFGAETMSGIGGTSAANIKNALGELKAGGALSEVMKMTLATGKNPFTPMSNSDVDLVSKNIAGVSQDQSPEDFFKAIQPYRKAYVNAYAGAVGADTLNNEVGRQVEKYTRENPNRTPRQEQTFRSVIQAKARQEYERRMRAKNGAPPRQQQRVIDFHDLP